MAGCGWGTQGSCCAEGAAVGTEGVAPRRRPPPGLGSLPGLPRRTQLGPELGKGTAPVRQQRDSRQRERRGGPPCGGRRLTASLSLTPSQRLHHVPVLHAKPQGLPEPAVRVPGRSLLPLPAGAGLLVGGGRAWRGLAPRGAAAAISCPLSGRRGGGWNTRTPPTPRQPWSSKGSSSTR